MSTDIGCNECGVKSGEVIIYNRDNHIIGRVTLHPPDSYHKWEAWRLSHRYYSIGAFHCQGAAILAVWGGENQQQGAR